MRAMFLRWTRDRWRLAEYILLAGFLLSRVLLLWRTYDDGVGWDSGDHLQMLDHWPWEQEVWSVRSRFYAFHPPLAFLIGRIFVVLGLHRDAAAQAAASLIMLCGFFVLRWLLLRLGALRSLRGLVTLYGGASLPIQVYLARSINMDCLVQTLAIAVIAASVTVVRGGGRLSWWVLTALLAAGLLTKATCLLLLGIPFLALVFFGPGLRAITLRSFTMVAVIPAVIACLAVSPYFIARYVIPEGRLLITNMDMREYDLDLLEGARERMVERGMTVFWRDFFWGVTPGMESIEMRDIYRVRLSNTWKDLWAGSMGNLRQTGLSFGLSSFYAWVGSALLLWGAWRALRTRGGAHPWGALGGVLAVLAAVQMCMIMLYAYQYPHSIGVPTKAIYITPALLVLWYLLGAAMPKDWKWSPLLPTCLLLAWTLLNGGLPVY